MKELTLNSIQTNIKNPLISRFLIKTNKNENININENTQKENIDLNTKESNKYELLFHLKHKIRQFFSHIIQTYFLPTGD